MKDSYPMPRIQDITDSLQGTKWFTSIDCVQAFHQIPIANERSEDLTTFRGSSGGLCRCRYMPMGLVNAMAIWSRCIDTVMSDYQHQCVLCYADDCLVYTKSESVDDHIRDLEGVFKKLDENGIKVKASKLKLGLTEMPFLGVMITEDGIKPNPEKTQAITAMKPENTETVEKHTGHICVLQTIYPQIQRKRVLFMSRRKRASTMKRTQRATLS